MAIIKGRVRKFGDNIDTDNITPAAVLHLPVEKLTEHAFSPIVKEFYKTVKDGDIIVAGNNFGCGSSREQATEVVKLLGIRFIICESMARIYFRNCVALGVYPIMCKGSHQLFNEGDEVEIDTEKGLLKNPKTGKSVYFKPLSGTPKQIFDAGGILLRLKQKVVNR
jgi:3-isopropylmalate dehydratase small subunit